MDGRQIDFAGPAAVVTADNVLGLGVYRRYDSCADALAAAQGDAHAGVEPWTDAIERRDRSHRARLDALAARMAA